MTPPAARNRGEAATSVIEFAVSDGGRSFGRYDPACAGVGPRGSRPIGASSIPAERNRS